jgi:hypothetical protein
MKKVSKELNLLNEYGEKDKLKDLLIPTIDSIINSYKLRYLTEWERDHSKEPFHEEIDKLSEIKKEVLDLLKSVEEGRITIDIKIEQ